MMKTITLVMSVIAIVAVIASGVFLKMFIDEAQERKTQLAQEQVTNKKLTKSIDKLEKIKDDLIKDEEQAKRLLSSAKGSLAKVEENLKDKEKELATLQQDFEDFAKNSAAKKSELARLNEDFNNLKEKLGEPSLSLDNLENQITSMEVEIDDLDDQLDAKSKQLSELAANKVEIEATHIKITKQKQEIITTFDTSSVELRLKSFDLNWGLATLTAQNVEALKIDDVLVVDLGVGDSLGVKRSVILRISGIENKTVIAQFVTEDASLINSLAVGQKAALIKI